MFFGGHLYPTDMIYKTGSSKPAPLLFPSFASASYKRHQVYGKKSMPLKAMNDPSPCTHYLINEGLSAYKTEVTDGGHAVASYDYKTNSDPIVQVSLSSPGTSYSW